MQGCRERNQLLRLIKIGRRTAQSAVHLRQCRAAHAVASGPEVN